MHVVVKSITKLKSIAHLFHPAGSRRCVICNWGNQKTGKGKEWKLDDATVQTPNQIDRLLKFVSTF